MDCLEGHLLTLEMPPVVRLSFLQEKVLNLGLCPFCHKKTLLYCGAGEEFFHYNCTECDRFFVLERELDENLLVD